MHLNSLFNKCRRTVILIPTKLCQDEQEEAIRNGWGCLSYLSGVKISDLVPFTVSQTSVDYQRPSWYLVGCFPLNKIPEISITRTTLIIWLEPQSTSIKEFLFLGFFNFLCLNWYFFGVNISCCRSHTDIRLRYLLLFYRGRFRNSRPASQPSYV